MAIALPACNGWIRISKARPLADVMAAFGQEKKAKQDAEWSDLGERGRTAQLLHSAGLRSKANRYADCRRKGRRRVCSQNPDHKFYRRFSCGLRFCVECAAMCHALLLRRYLLLLLAFARSQPIKPGYTLAKINFTTRSADEVPTPGSIRAFNAALRKTLKRCIPKGSAFGVLWVDEFGPEKGGQREIRQARGFNLHAHGLYYGPYLNWSQVRAGWSEVTNSEGNGFWVKGIKGWRVNFERGMRRALGQLLRYVSKPQAQTPERIAALERAFAGVRRVHSLGLFYRLPKVESSSADETVEATGEKDRCPLCGGAFYCEPGWKFASIKELEEEGLRDIDEVRINSNRDRVFGGGP